MGRELKNEFRKLIKTVKQKTPNIENLEPHPFIEALEEVAVLAGDIENENDPYYEFLAGLRTCLQGLAHADVNNFENKINVLNEFISSEETLITKEKCTSNQLKAAGILILCALEWVVLTVIMGAGAAALGALALILCAASPTIPIGPALLLISALGAALGAISGIAGACYLSYETTQALKTSSWAGFEAHDSLWDLLVTGKDKKTQISEKLKSHFSFFNKATENELPKDNIEGQLTPTI